jgi:NAD(P)-dependent dehydrogenase (short-subunit alcohol dehydrogenase family)
MNTRVKAGIAAVALGAFFYPRRAEGGEFEGKTVLITGGSRGLGFVLARLFAEEGARIAICSRSETELRNAELKLRRRTDQILTHVCDVGDPAQVEAFVQAALERFGSIDVVVNNAGVIQVGPLEAMSREDFLDNMEVTFAGTLNVTNAALPALERSGGRIMNITSIGGVVAVPHLAPYTAAKHAAVGLSEALSIELKRKGIAVTTVVPGLMRTGSYGNALFKGKRETEYSLFALGASLPLVSMDAERAAMKMVDACRRRIPYVVVGAPAKMARLIFQLFPGTSLKLLGTLDRVLPGASPGDRHRAAERGFDHETALTQSPVTMLAQEAALKYNER